VKPLLGRQTVRSLTSRDIEKFQLDIAGGKTVRDREKRRGGTARGGKGVATRTVGMLGTILEFARRRQHITTNPARGVERFPEGRQRRFLDLDEIVALGNAMRFAEAERSVNPTGLCALRLLLLTGLRRMEALALEWQWLDFRARCIRFPDTKSGGTAASDWGRCSQTVAGTRDR
jgi:integrase